MQNWKNENEGPEMTDGKWSTGICRTRKWRTCLCDIRSHMRQRN